jgi:cytochrome c biogenesis protein CcmG/thiol:disulfide interchange protein DsbE
MLLRIVAVFLLMVPALFSQTGPKLGQPAPDFTLKDSSGAPVRLSALKGKVVLLDFWATWCHGCQTEIPWYVDFEKKYGKVGLEAIGVSMDEDGWKAVKPYLRQHSINYPIVVATKDVANEYGGLPSLPVTLLIDRKGNIAELHAGMVDKNEFEKKIRQLLHNSAM